MIPSQDGYKLEGKACALIINNVFDDPDKRKTVLDYDKYLRAGAEGDSKKMRALFEDALHFGLVEIGSDVCSEVGKAIRKTRKSTACLHT